MRYPALIILALLMMFCSSPQNLKNDPNVVEISTSDASGLIETYSAGLFEIKAAEIAVDKASDTEIKNYAGALAGINQKVNNEISLIAYNRKLKLPVEMNTFQQAKLDSLKKNSSPNFEFVFISQIENNQKMAVDLYERISKESEDNEITTWAIHTLPTIRDNLDKSILLKQKILNRNKK